MPESNDGKRSANRAIAFASLTAVGVGLFGFLLLHYGLAVYGIVVFLAVPIAAGFVARAVAGPGSNTFIAAATALFIGLGILIVTESEGWVCILMAMPLIAVGILIGVAL